MVTMTQLYISMIKMSTRRYPHELRISKGIARPPSLKLRQGKLDFQFHPADERV